jgi:hypothetical protein
MRFRMVVVVLAIILILVGATYFLESANVPDIPDTEYAILTMMVIIACVGLIIMSHRAGNPVGWILTLTAFSLALFGFSKEYGRYALVTHPGSLPLGLLFAWLNSWVWVFFTGPVILFLPLLFPTGQFLSKRWMYFGWICFGYLVVLICLDAVKPGPMGNFETIENPIGINSQFLFSETTNFLVSVTIAPLFVISILSLFLRYRRSEKEKRAQIKWFFYIISLFVPYIIYGTLSDLGLFPGVPTSVSTYIFSAYLALFAITIGIAIFKYHLYDIDLIIRRTLQYGLLTLLLGLAYMSLVVMFGQLFQTVMGQTSQFALVLSTLIIAALFNPLRRGIQQVIDRRFYRQKYSMDLALQEFSSAARREVELTHLTEGLLHVVEKTIQPEQISVWIRKVEH